LSEHPIKGLMSAVMENLKEMVNVNTIVGDSVQAPNGTVIIPVSHVAFGFIAGGGEINFGNKKDELSISELDNKDSTFPFTGGSGAGVSIKPVAFMVAGEENIKLLSVNANSKLDRVLDKVPELTDKAADAIKKIMCQKKKLEDETFNNPIADDTGKPL
jgi:sporulation protein YtfJ